MNQLSFKKIHLKTSFAIWWAFCLGLCVNALRSSQLTTWSRSTTLKGTPIYDITRFIKIDKDRKGSTRVMTGWLQTIPSKTCKWRLHNSDIIHKSQNAPVPYPTTLHSEQKRAHFCSEWGIVGYGKGAFWDLWNWSIRPLLASLLDCFTARGMKPIDSLRQQINSSHIVDMAAYDLATQYVAYPAMA